MRNEPPLDSARDRPDPLDALIDQAARQIVAGEPSSVLRGAVRERLAERRPVWSLVPAWGVAVGVALVALIVGRALLGPAGTPGERDNVRPTIELAETPDAPDASRPTIDVETAPAGEAVGSRSVRLQADQRRLTRRLADDPAVTPQEEEPLIPPLAIEPLVTVQIGVRDPIIVESSGVMPIAIEPLQIEPLRSIE